MIAWRQGAKLKILTQRLKRTKAISFFIKLSSCCSLSNQTSSIGREKVLRRFPRLRPYQLSIIFLRVLSQIYYTLQYLTLNVSLPNEFKQLFIIFALTHLGTFSISNGHCIHIHVFFLELIDLTNLLHELHVGLNLQYLCQYPLLDLLSNARAAFKLGLSKVCT